MTSTSVHQKFSGLLIVIGSLVFVCGGAIHPRINSSLGALGSTEFFQNFYMHIAHHGSWRLIHGMILVGPVLWLLGIGSLWSGRNGWTRMATTAMTLAATAWTFLSGFAVPLALFPSPWRGIAETLPFAGMIQTPVDIFLQKQEGLALLAVMGRQLLWALVLLLLGRWMLAAATRRLVVQGG